MKLTVYRISASQLSEWRTTISWSNLFSLSFPDAQVCLSLTDPMLPIANIPKYLTTTYYNFLVGGFNPFEQY